MPLGVEAPPEVELAGDLRKPGLEGRALALEVREVELHAQEEAAALGIGRVLIGANDVRTGFGETGGERRDDPLAVAARDDEAGEIGVRGHFWRS